MPVARSFLVQNGREVLDMLEVDDGSDRRLLCELSATHPLSGSQMIKRFTYPRYMIKEGERLDWNMKLVPLPDEK